MTSSIAADRHAKASRFSSQLSTSASASASMSYSASSSSRSLRRRRTHRHVIAHTVSATSQNQTNVLGVQRAWGCGGPRSLLKNSPLRRCRASTTRSCARAASMRRSRESAPSASGPSTASAASDGSVQRAWNALRYQPTTWLSLAVTRSPGASTHVALSSAEATRHEALTRWGNGASSSTESHPRLLPRSEAGPRNQYGCSDSECANHSSWVVSPLRLYTTRPFVSSGCRSKAPSQLDTQPRPSHQPPEDSA